MIQIVGLWCQKCKKLLKKKKEKATCGGGHTKEGCFREHLEHLEMSEHNCVAEIALHILEIKRQENDVIAGKRKLHRQCITAGSLS